jgi:hypothetical protein
LILLALAIVAVTWLFAGGGIRVLIRDFGQT